MQKFVVKKSKSAAPLAPPPSSSLSQSSNQPAQVRSSNAIPALLTEKASTTATDASQKAANACDLLSPTITPPTTTTASPSRSNATKKVAAPKPPVTKATNGHSMGASSPSSASHVKMSGYLKKKRNKMGGWRKLWFVLQNQLLLSYSSREDYEKKLAPFKDVLNLVPGTIIRPTKGPRFTIETTTNLIYTYRCDDNKVCSEWITALVESLGLHTGDSKLQNATNKLHFSMENLSKPNASSSTSTSPASSFMSSRSCDSIYRPKNNKIAPKLPVAQNTARLLDRVNHSTNKNDDSAMRGTPVQKVQNFRLHPNEAHVNQSLDVHRINRMFNTSEANTKTKITVNNGKSTSRKEFGAAVDSVNSQSHRKSAAARDEHQKHRRRHHHHHHRSKDMTDAMNNKTASATAYITMANNNFLDKNSNRNLITMEEEEPCTAHEESFQNGNCSLEEQMQRISLEHDSNSNPHVTCVRKESATSSIASPSLSSSSSVSSGSSAVSTASTASASKFQLLSTPKIIHENANQVDSLTSGQNSMGEPIYAVVNLKNKYENRAKKKSVEEPCVTECIQRQKERPNSFHVISGDYEEVLHLSADCVDGAEDEENIYEPINIPELSTKGPLWRYFSKINIDALAEIRRWRKEHQQQNSKDEHPTTVTAAFSDIRKRFGQHRKSIKNRMKKLYNRSNSCDDHHDVVHMHSNGNNVIDDLGSQGASGSSASDSSDKPIESKIRRSATAKNEGGYFNKRDRYLFGSMLKKSRTSLCLDDGAQRKKFIVAVGNGDGLKKKSIRSFEKKECHSKFYD